MKVAISNLKPAEFDKLPIFPVQVTKQIIKDKKTNQTTGTQYHANLVLNQLLAIRSDKFNKDSYGLVVVGLDKKFVQANETVNAKVLFSKGTKADGSKYYMFEGYINQDVTIRAILSHQEVVLLNKLIKRGDIDKDKVIFVERLADDVPEISDTQSEEELVF